MSIRNIFLIMIVLSLGILILSGCQQPITPTTECQADSDCVPDQCCQATDCIPASQKLPCGELCSVICKPGTMDCGGSCTCDNGQCTPHIKLKVTQTSCAVNSDCACGRNIVTGDCFYGNKDYVNVSQQCPDYCTGIAGNFEIQCLNNTCTQVNVKNNPAPKCAKDSDCAPEQCCHATSCIPANQKDVCTLLCTNVCLPGTIDCGGSCTCENGECIAKLNNLTAEVTPPINECTTDSDCAPEQCCHPTTCIPTEQKGVCNLACTNNCQPETMDCGGFCACEAGKCTAHLNDIKENETPVQTSACTTDDDCVPADCCHANSCTIKEDGPDCAAVSCSAECVGQTMDCGGFCACQNGKCVAELNDL